MVSGHDEVRWQNECTWDRAEFGTGNSICGHCLASARKIKRLQLRKREKKIKIENILWLTCVFNSLYKSVSMRHCTMYTSFIWSMSTERIISLMSMICWIQCDAISICFTKKNIDVWDFVATYIFMLEASQDFDFSQGTLTVGLMLKRRYLLDGYFSFG